MATTFVSTTTLAIVSGEFIEVAVFPFIAVGITQIANMTNMINIIALIVSTRLNYADGTYFENQHEDKGNQPAHEGIVVSMQMAREASWKKKVVMWTGSRRNCGCGFNGYTPLQLANDAPQCVGFNLVSEEPTALLQADLEKSLGEFLMIVEEFSYSKFGVFY